MLPLQLLVACRPTGVPPCLESEPAARGPRPGNIVWIVMDDVGVDKVASYGVHPRPAPTPRLDALAAQGLRFTSAYSEPVCSSARAALLTGLRPVHNGVGQNVGDEAGDDLHEEVVLLPEALAGAAGRWSSMAVGKWHLTALDASAPFAPLRHGFDRFDGVLANANKALDREPGEGFDYWHWEHVVDGDVSISDDYLLSHQADTAIRALSELSEPFFLYVALSAAHIPLHVPPIDLWSRADPSDGTPGTGDAMIEAMDHEIGRLVDAIGDSATVFVTSDNGTAAALLRPPSDPDRAKTSVYSGGTHVPLIVVGPGVVPGVSDALVHATDLFPTALDLADVDPSLLDLDGRSLLPSLDGDDDHGRRCAFTEMFGPNGQIGHHEAITVMDDQFALVRADQDDGGELYRRDPLAPAEGEDLLLQPLDRDAEEALVRLRTWRHRDFDAAATGG